MTALTKNAMHAALWYTRAGGSDPRLGDYNSVRLKRAEYISGRHSVTVEENGMRFRVHSLDGDWVGEGVLMDEDKTNPGTYAIKF